ncbi:hypothetical protein GARC_1305 [Paraglaciecola arctica BSs20135]|uniref:Uncharacterized protein n=1 Tax=Paraglaciecola arctica BSs20135 TaxID=493475 RepID=K6YJF0_9ALTE|nr:hypothetical protein GARC_1305 [Paraglaciecola arctica BSs20135]
MDSPSTKYIEVFRNPILTNLSQLILKINIAGMDGYLCSKVKLQLQ